MEATKGNVSVNVTVDDSSSAVSLNATNTEQSIDVQVNEIFGTGVSSVTQTKTSTESSGENEITCVLTNGKTTVFKILNGAKGQDGEKGADGQQGEKGEKGDKGDTGTVIIPSFYVDDDGNLVMEYDTEG